MFLVEPVLFIWIKYKLAARHQTEIINFEEGIFVGLFMILHLQDRISFLLQDLVCMLSLKINWKNHFNESNQIIMLVKKCCWSDVLFYSVCIERNMTSTSQYKKKIFKCDIDENIFWHYYSSIVLQLQRWYLPFLGCQVGNKSIISEMWIRWGWRGSGSVLQ